MIGRIAVVATLALSAAFIALLPAPTLADEATVRRVVESKLNGVKVASITKLPNADLYEVAFETPGGWQLVYTDANANYLIFGRDLGVLDTKADRDLAEERLAKLNAVPFANLPLDQSFKIVRGKGTRRFAYFSDPNCPYCKRLDQELVKLDDVTIHVFLYPILSPDSVAKAKSVWCSKDRAKTWVDMMVKGIRPTADGSCATPVDKNLALGQQLRVNGTPTMFFENGQRVSGAIPGEQLEQILAAAKTK